MKAIKIKNNRKRPVGHCGISLYTYVHTLYNIYDNYDVVGYTINAPEIFAPYSEYLRISKEIDNSRATNIGHGGDVRTALILEGFIVVDNITY